MTPYRQRVVHVTSAHRASDTRIFEKECRSLHRAGFDVHLVATGERPVAPFPVHVLPRSGRRLTRTSIGGFRAVLAAIQLRPALVHLHDPELIPWIGLFHALGIFVIFDAHEDIPATMADHPTFGRAARSLITFIYRRLVQFVGTSANAVVTATPTIALAYPQDRVVVVQNFPMLDEWDDVEPGQGDPLTLVYVGWVSEQRGAWPMMRAMERLGPELGARLKIAGWVREPLMAELEASPGWQYVEFLGPLDRSGIVDLLSSSSVGLLLFQPSANNTASQPTKLFEYMAAGLPVVTSDFPLWRQLVSDADAGLVVPPDDVEGIVDAVRTILGDRVAAAAMGRRGRLTIYDHRNWARETEQLIALYRTLLPA